MNHSLQKGKLGGDGMREIEIVPYNNPSVAGIIAGISKGKIWRDNVHFPGLYITYSYCVGGCGIAGDISAYTDAELRRFLDRVLGDMRKVGEEYFEFASESEEISNRVLKLYKGEYEIFSEMEYSYRREKSYDEIGELPKNISICEMDGLAYADADMLRNRMQESWNTKEDFLKYSKSYVAVCQDKVIGVIFGSARYENVITIDIEVDEVYRKKGIGAVLAKTMVNQCAKEGLVLQWDCIESNIPSRNLVSALGFKPLKSRPYYWFKI